MFVSNPVFANTNKDDQDLAKKYQELKKQLNEYKGKIAKSTKLIKQYQELLKEIVEYEDRILVEAQKTQVQIVVRIPYRDGFKGGESATGTVIAKTIAKVQFDGKTLENIVYFIHSNPHVINDIEKVLEMYKEARIRIYILGKNNSEANAEIVAWNWETAGLLLRVEISQDQLENFKFKVATISSKLPISWIASKFSDNLVPDRVYLFGYPYLELNDSSGRVSRYITNEIIRERTKNYAYRLIKTMHIPAKGLVGPGQSGGGIFMLNKKTGSAEWVGTTTLGMNQLIIGIPVDVTVERFLKQISALRGLIDFSKFKLEYYLGLSQTVEYKDISKKENNN